MNNTCSFLSRLCHYPILRRATIVLFVLAWSSLAFCGEVAVPALTVVTKVSFQYEQFRQGFNTRLPTAPNSWHIESKITCNDRSQIEVLPIYLYSEIQSSKTNAFENSSTICPRSFSDAFSAAAQNGLTIAPTDLSGKIETTVSLPMEQLDDPSVFKPGDSIAAYTGSRTFTATLTVDAKPVAWDKLGVSPHSTINATWEFESIWAAPDKVRTDQSFQMVYLGPIIRSVSAAPGEAYLVAVRLNYVPNESGGNMKQSSVQFIKVTPTLPKDIAKAFPGCASAEEFCNATIRLVTKQGFGVVQELDPRGQIIEATPLHLAVVNGHKDVADLLRQHGGQE